MVKLVEVSTIGIQRRTDRGVHRKDILATSTRRLEHRQPFCLPCTVLAIIIRGAICHRASKQDLYWSGTTEAC